MSKWHHSTTSAHSYSYQQSPNAHSAWMTRYIKLNPLRGEMRSTYNSGNPKASRFLRGRHSVSCVIENNSKTKYDLTVYRDGSGLVTVTRDGSTLWEVKVSPEQLSALDDINGVKAVDVKIHP